MRHQYLATFIQTRDAARARGDHGVERAMTAELDRLGYREAVETVEPERQVVATRRRGRPPKPRCEHDKIVGRCVECDDEELV